VRLGCAAELRAVAGLAGDPGAARQRDYARAAGPAALPGWLSDEFTSERCAQAVA
jgi:hypothetical protein